jgi:uncharacterized protein (DUF1919 family)
MTKSEALVLKFRRMVAQSRLRGTDFSIVSNNCWSLHIYQNLNIPYTTPFVGLFLSPTAYLRLLRDFDTLITGSLTFKPVSDEPLMNRLREAHTHRWPIGCLNGLVEIQFMHYQSEAEAMEKWERRRTRLVNDPNRLFFEFCDRDGCTLEQMKNFDRLPLKNKVLFTTRKEITTNCAVRIPLDRDCVPDGVELARLSPRYFDGTDWLLGGNGHPKLLTGWLNCL